MELKLKLVGGDQELGKEFKRLLRCSVVGGKDTVEGRDAAQMVQRGSGRNEDGAEEAVAKYMDLPS